MVCAGVETIPGASLMDVPQPDVDTVQISCNLTSIESNTFRGSKNIRQIDLPWIALKMLPSGLFDGLSQLYKEDPSRNKLTTFPDDPFEDLSAVVILNLSHNRLTNIPDAMTRCLPHLLIIYLDHNLFTDITTSDVRIADGRSDIHINLSHNNMSEISASRRLKGN